MIPLFLRGTYSIGPNGFSKIVEGDYLGIYYFSGWGLQILTIKGGKKSVKLYFKRLAKVLKYGW